MRYRGIVGRTVGTAVATAMLLVMAPVPVAHAANLVVGMEIVAGKHSCTLGFFGFNAAGDRLAVTAGHCTDWPDQKVYNRFGNVIGVVVARKSDGLNARGKMTGSRGYSIILLSKKFSLEPYFTKAGTVAEGAWVTKFGKRTGKTQGRVTNISYTADRPDLAVMDSDAVQLPGDSGGPWVTGPGAILVGLSSSGNQDTVGGENGKSSAQPIGSVLKMIRSGAGRWGNGFKVWIER